MEKVKIAWIDDNIKDRESDKKNIESENLEIKIILPKFFENNIKKEIFDLYLVDYFLDEKENDGERYEHKGIAIAGIIRDEYPLVPIYATSNKIKNKNGIFKSKSGLARNMFDRVLPFKEIQMKGKKILYKDALSFREIKNTKKNDWKALMKLLGAPNDTIDYIRLVLPTDLKSGFSDDDQNFLISFADWLFNILFNIPGFLYDEFNTATYLELTLEGFLKIKEEFIQAEYKGIFSETIDKLWWKNSLNDILLSKSDNINGNDFHPCEIISELFEIKDKDFARCCVCNEKLPDSLGVNIKNKMDIRPVHYFCSIPDENIKRELYFDEARLFEL